MELEAKNDTLLNYLNNYIRNNFNIEPINNKLTISRNIQDKFKPKKNNISLLFITFIIFLYFEIILSNSHITLKINKAGLHNLFYKGGVQNARHECFGGQEHIPTSIIINHTWHEQIPEQYNFTNEQNTIYLYFDEKKTDFKCLFYGCNGIDEIDLSNLDTSNVYNMDLMFSGCSSLTSINFENFNTSKVSSMYGMFSGCSSLRSLDLSNFITDNLISIRIMFGNCVSLTSLNLLNFKTSNIVDMGWLFFNCLSLKSLDLSNFDTWRLEKMDYMFYLCSSLTSLIISNFDTSKVNEMQGLFAFCSSLTSIDLSHFVTSALENISFMFQGCTNLTYINLNNFDTSKVIYMNSSFSGCSSLTSLDISNFITSNVISMESMFSGCFSLTSLDLTKFDTNNVITMHAMFKECMSLKYLNLNNFKTPLVENMSWMFYKCSSLISLDITNFDTSRVVNMRIMFGECSSLTSLDLKNFNTSSVVDLGYMFYQCRNLTFINLSSFKTASTLFFDYMFYGCISLKSLDITNFETYNATNLNCMFFSCSSLTSLDLHNFDTSQVTEMAYMFCGCSSLTSMDLSSFNTKKVVNLIGLFFQCHSLKSLDLSNFNTSNVIRMNQMFGECFDLISLDISAFETSKVIDMNNMFFRCYNLTSLNLKNFDTSNVENMAWMFYECYKLEYLDISNFSTSKVKSMAAMLVRCRSLISLDLSNFDTSSLTNAFHMFEECVSLTSLNLSNFKTSSIENMHAMFFNNNKLTSLDLSNFDFSKVTDIEIMFYGCPNLKYLNINRLVINNNNTLFLNFIDNNMINPTICINDEQSLDKIISSYYKCPYELNCSENWGEFMHNVQNSNNLCLGNCLLSKFNSNDNSRCYQICSYYFYFDEKINKYICTEKLQCPEQYNKLISDKNECVKSCKETKEYKYEFGLSNKCFSSCPENFVEKKDKPYYCSFSISNNTSKTIIDLIKSGMLNEVLSNVITNNETFTMNEGDDTHLISTLSSNLKRTNFSSIDFGTCEDLIRNKNNISDLEELILYEIEHSVKGFNIPIIEYLLFTSDGKTQLDLNICDNTTIQYYIPVSIDESDMEKYDPSSDYYNDECSKLSNEDGVDMTLYDRKNQFNDKNMSLCEKGCVYQGFDNNIKKVKCDCNIKNNMSYYSDGTNKRDLLNKIEDNSKTSSNLKVTQCINNVFNSPKQLVSNSGFITLFIILIIFIIIFIIFCKKGIRLLKEKIDEIIYNKFDKKNISKINNNNKIGKNESNKNMNKLNKENKIIKNTKNAKKIMNKKLPKKSMKKSKSQKINSKNKLINFDNNKNLELINKPYHKITSKGSSINIGNNNVNDIQTEERPDKENDYELNTLEYIPAIKYDKRTFCEYYSSLLKNKQLFLFTFCSFNDYNSGIIKKFILFLSFALHYTISALFFTDDTMHQIYEDGGKYNISYQFPKILISALSATVALRIMLETLILTDRDILKVKHSTTKVIAEQMKAKVLKCINIKFAIFFVINFILLILFWFYLTCFSDTYANTQVYLIENTLIAFAISFCYPFIWNIFPSVLRLCALNNRKPDKKCFYTFSKILHVI